MIKVIQVWQRKHFVTLVTGIVLCRISEIRKQQIHQESVSYWSDIYRNPVHSTYFQVKLFIGFELIFILVSIVGYPGCFIPEPDPKNFSSRIRIRTFFIPDPGS
jgi:hypothetical protein